MADLQSRPDLATLSPPHDGVRQRAQLLRRALGQAIRQTDPGAGSLSGLLLGAYARIDDVLDDADAEHAALVGACVQAESALRVCLARPEIE